LIRQSDEREQDKGREVRKNERKRQGREVERGFQIVRKEGMREGEVKEK